MNKVYLDYAAATPISAQVLKAMQPFFESNFYNPSALYLDAQSAKSSLTEARAEVANQLGCKSSEVLFVAGGTESDNLAINGIMQKFPGKNLVVSAIEHDAVLQPAEQYDCRIANVAQDAQVDLQDLQAKINGDTVLVSVMYANNEVGSIQPIKEITKIIKKIRNTRQVEAERKNIDPLPLYFHTDACQATNYLSLLVNTLGVDLMTLNGGKIYGPKQSGILFVRTGVELKPQILGGGQERGFRSGTENIASAIGFATALNEAAEQRDTESNRLIALRDNMIDRLLRIDGLTINGSAHRLANNIHFTVAGYDNERLLMELDERGFMVATGSACSASSDEPSHVLKAMGIPDHDARSSIRLTLGRQTTENDIKNFLTNLEELVRNK